MRSNILKAIIIAAFILTAVPQTAHARAILEFFFPMLKEEGPDPSKTLTAPFADPNEKNALTVGQGLPENAVPLEQAHKPSKQVGEWLTMAASEAMTFRDADYKATIEKTGRHFTAEGKAQFLTFLEENSFIRVLETGRFNISGFVQEDPILLNEGAVDGHYRWLFQVPVMVSYIDRGAKGYKDVANPVSQLITLTVQIGRTSDQTPGQDMLIERFSGKIQSIIKK